MKDDSQEGFKSLGSLFTQKRVADKKPPAYQWQDLALRVVKELNIPPFKKSSVFKICRDNSKEFVEMCLTDTQELCHDGERWKYFFKVVDNRLKGVTLQKNG
jgi:hypothetical protein